MNIPDQKFNIPGFAAAAVSGMSLTGKFMTWQDGDKKINVVFANGKVMIKHQRGL
jgi:hypothetical protein